MKALENEIRRIDFVGCGNDYFDAFFDVKMQGQSRQVGDRCLQGVEAIVERQERVAPEGNDDGPVCSGEHRGAWVRRAGSEVMDRASPPPLGDRLRIDAGSPGQGPQARLLCLYCSTDRLCRRDAAV